MGTLPLGGIKLGILQRIKDRLFGRKKPIIISQEDVSISFMNEVGEVEEYPLDPIGSEDYVGLFESFEECSFSVELVTATAADSGDYLMDLGDIAWSPVNASFEFLDEYPPYSTEAAEDLLVSFLTDDQKETYKRFGYIEEVGHLTNLSYIITKRVNGNIIVYLDEDFVGTICAIPDEMVPIEDQLLAQLLLIRGAELELYKRGNLLNGMDEFIMNNFPEIDKERERALIRDMVERFGVSRERLITYYDHYDMDLEENDQTPL